MYLSVMSVMPVAGLMTSVRCLSPPKKSVFMLCPMTRSWVVTMKGRFCFCGMASVFFLSSSGSMNLWLFCSSSYILCLLLFCVVVKYWVRIFINVYVHLITKGQKNRMDSWFKQALSDRRFLVVILVGAFCLGVCVGVILTPGVLSGSVECVAKCPIPNTVSNFSYVVLS